MNKIFFLVFSLFFVACTTQNDGDMLVDYVDPLIGTAPSTTLSALKHGHGTENNSQVVPFVTMPFGMTNWTAQTKDTETKCVAPYYYADSLVQGFRGSHWLSGSCVQDYGSMTIMPLSGKLVCLPEERAAIFSHKDELASPYYYSLRLTNEKILAEMTATKRCGLFRFSFDKAGQAHIVVNPNSDEGLGTIRILPERNEIEITNPVHRIYQGWGEEAGFSGNFVVRFSRPFNEYGCYSGDSTFFSKDRVSAQDQSGAFVSFTLEENEEIEVYIGSSFTSIGQARANLNEESSGLDFDSAKELLKQNWEELFGKVKVEGKRQEDKIKFYTAMYHTFLHPRVFSDCDGTYRSFAGGENVMNAGHDEYYGDFSMWDTWRATLPLFNLLVPEKSADMMRSLLLKAEQGGWLPIFPCWNSYTSAMIGDHILVSLADAQAKGILEIGDDDMTFLLQNAFKSPDDYLEYREGKGRRALNSYIRYGYIPLEDSVLESFHQNEQVSRTLEYAFDDFALGRLCKMKGRVEADLLMERSQNYRLLYSTADSCVRARYADGSFVEDLDKFKRVSWITEGTPYQYTWFVPHDIAGLMDEMGGEDAFNANLDAFHYSGQYWHGNEPGHHIPFLYNYSGQAWKSQELVSRILEEEYSTGPGGLSGNDDAGQMSAWYVFAAIGFYPVCPSVPEYVITGPHFDKVSIDVGDGRYVQIYADGASDGRNYIQEYSLDSKFIDRTWLNHYDLVNGAKLDFEMGDTPNKAWGTSEGARPFSVSSIRK